MISSHISIHIDVSIHHSIRASGSSYSKITTSLINKTLKFQMLISQICQHFLLKNVEVFAVQKLLSFFQQKISVY